MCSQVLCMNPIDYNNILVFRERILRGSETRTYVGNYHLTGSNVFAQIHC